MILSKIYKETSKPAYNIGKGSVVSSLKTETNSHLCSNVHFSLWKIHSLLVAWSLVSLGMSTPSQTSTASQSLGSAPLILSCHFCTSPCALISWDKYL